ncbi:protein FilE, partial [Acinetobacter pittii]|nr:protein FilE [Acinetobacter pittii]
MVRQYKWMFRPKLAISILSVAMVSVSVSYADGFYTIIGPDGRPMIVPSKKVDQKRQLPPRVEIQSQNLPNKIIIDPAQKVSKEKTTIDSPKKMEQSTQKKLNTAPTAP